MRAPRVLVSTLAARTGGVPAMLRFALDTLRSAGLEPIVAHYEPYSQAPQLSVPAWALGRRRPAGQAAPPMFGAPTHAIGAWLPELEFTHYLPTPAWRQLMAGCDAFLVVSGNALAATAFARTGRPYVAWVATDWEGDRRDRVRNFPWPRRLLDRWVNAPVIRRLEREVLGRGHTLALSEHTARSLDALTPAPCVRGTLPMPVDVERFRPDPAARVPGRIGFSGRIDDPRKNIGLLLEAFARLRSQGLGTSLHLIGGAPTPALAQAALRLGIAEQVVFVPHLSPDELAQTLRTLDVFVLPSHQEGLCIAALEAMASGVPVVSTRCGGPQEYVIPGQTGELVGFDPTEMAEAIGALLREPQRRQAQGTAARALIERRYTLQRSRSTLLQALATTFPHLQMHSHGGTRAP